MFFRSSSFVYLSYKRRQKNAKIRDNKNPGQLAVSEQRVGTFYSRERRKMPSKIVYGNVQLRSAIARCKSAMRCDFATHDVNRAISELSLRCGERGSREAA